MNAVNQCTLQDSFQKPKGQADTVEEQFSEFLNEVINESLTDNADVPEYSMKELGIEYTCQESADGEEHSQDCSEEIRDSGNSMLPPTPADLTNKSDHANTTHLSGNVAGRSPELNSLPPESNKNDIEQNAVNQQPLLTSLKDYKYDIGESSFSTIDPLPILRSDSTLSDSSATSTRSFAFPILHSEWNSSPVKLINSNQRHNNLPKSHRRTWWASICCCRF